MVYILIWIVLGIHSTWFYIYRARRENDINVNQVVAMIMAFIFPIISHIATIIIYPPTLDIKKLFKIS